MGIKEKNGVFEETLKYFKGDSLAADVWMNKYALKTDSGYLESNPDEIHKRILLLQLQLPLLLLLQLLLPLQLQLLPSLSTQIIVVPFLSYRSITDYGFYGA